MNPTRLLTRYAELRETRGQLRALSLTVSAGERCRACQQGRRTWIYDRMVRTYDREERVLEHLGRHHPTRGGVRVCGDGRALERLGSDLLGGRRRTSRPSPRVGEVAVLAAAVGGVAAAHQVASPEGASREDALWAAFLGR